MRMRPLPVTVAAILLVLLSLTNFPWLYFWFLFPGAEEPPAFFLYLGYVVGVVGIVLAVGLWMMKWWSFWLTIVVCVLNFLLALPGVLFAPGVALKAFNGIAVIVAVLIVVLVMLPGSRRAFAAT
jgi:peptidoglycan/LPS O-acetylase OafA/YrhL